MAALQKLINSLVEVIVGYYDIKSGGNTIDKFIEKLHPIDKLHPLANLLKMTPENLNATLAKTIEETATIKETRVNFLNYLANIIKDVKPLVDQKEPLSDEELCFVKKTLIDLITHCQQLSPLSHSDLYHFEYNGQKIAAFGFETGYIRVSPCTTGDLIRRLFPVPGFTLTSTQYPMSEIKEFVETMVTDHQDYLLSGQENAELATKINTLEKENRGLSWKTRSLQHQLDQLSTYEKEEQAPPSKQATSYSQYPRKVVSGLFSQVFFHKKSSEIAELEKSDRIPSCKLGHSSDDPE
ncbi:MAG: hypothetical protein A3F46_00985 [Legionellales bacterium RIFCSPHIGHO2_12_FULL_42_9]|nr:MAG: hypothetical protein A3F46_00985 [Legionellales bacterium RIFCSPHIGHO2_12_FULL_42_9]